MPFRNRIHGVVLTTPQYFNESLLDINNGHFAWEEAPRLGFHGYAESARRWGPSLRASQVLAKLSWQGLSCVIARGFSVRSLFSSRIEGRRKGEPLLSWSSWGRSERRWSSGINWLLVEPIDLHRTCERKTFFADDYTSVRGRARRSHRCLQKCQLSHFLLLYVVQICMHKVAETMFIRSNTKTKYKRMEMKHIKQEKASDVDNTFLKRITGT